MGTNNKIIEYLNQILKNELTAVHQFFLHSRMYQSWGLTKLAAKEYEESLDEMKHSDALIQRLLFLEGNPNLQEMKQLRIGKNVKEALQFDLKLEKEAATDLNSAIAECEALQDFSTRDLLLSILKSEELHLEWLQTQLHLISQISLEGFIQTQIA